MLDFRDANPRDLRLPPSRAYGADPEKLRRQIARFGSLISGMPPIVVYEAADGVLVIYDGVTRATRVARLRPDELVRVEVIGRLKRPYAALPTVEEML